MAKKSKWPLNRWVSVEEGLPEVHLEEDDYGPFLVSDPVLVQRSDCREMAVAYYEDDSQPSDEIAPYKGWVTIDAVMIGNSVTHWRPLPAPPEAQNEP